MFSGSQATHEPRLSCAEAGENTCNSKFQKDTYMPAIEVEAEEYEECG
jgi:hypothetical protein